MSNYLELYKNNLELDKSKNSELLRKYEEYIRNPKKESCPFDKKDNIVTVCAAGIRAESAKKFFESRGYNVANGGRWTNLKDLS